MAGNPGGTVAFSDLAKGTTNQDDHLKETATTNKMKQEPGEGGGATDQKQGGEGDAAFVGVSCYT